MIDCLLDAFIDTLHLVPFLFFTFLVLELIEHKVNKKPAMLPRRCSNSG